MKVFVRLNGYTYTKLRLIDVRETKWHYIDKGGVRYAKVTDPTRYGGAIGKSKSREYEPSDYIYSLDNKEIIAEHIAQIYNDLEFILRDKILKHVGTMDYRNLRRLGDFINGIKKR